MRKIYQIDEIRIIKRFLFIPKLIDNEKRWLEKAEIEQKMGCIKNKWQWVDTKWINN